MTPTEWVAEVERLCKRHKRGEITARACFREALRHSIDVVKADAYAPTEPLGDEERP
jgi:hypothetical protein